MRLMITDSNVAKESPKDALLLSLIASVSILLSTYELYRWVELVIVFLHVLLSLAMVCLVALLYTKPWRHRTLGTAIIIVSLLLLSFDVGLNLFAEVGLYLFGPALGVIGGVLGFRWKPVAILSHEFKKLKTTIKTVEADVGEVKKKLGALRTCPKCETWVLDPNATFCGICGAELPKVITATKRKSRGARSTNQRV